LSDAELKVARLALYLTTGLAVFYILMLAGGGGL